MIYHDVEIPEQKITEFCIKNKIRRLSLFGSILRDDFGPDSDVDVLIEFAHEAHIGLIGLAGMEIELSRILGRKVDLNTPNSLSHYFREEILSSAETQYDAAA